ncbi:MAG: hypothetical protein ACRCXZ_01115 [Patescibacteria group bacterium]
MKESGQTRNQLWAKMNTDRATGIVQTKIFGIPNGISAQEVIPPQMQVESLRQNYKQIRSKLLELGSKKFSSQEQAERLSKVPEIRSKLCSQPLIHMTHDSKLVPVNAPYVELLSYQKVKEVKAEQKGNTFQSDIETGRDQFVYLTLGATYLGGGNSTKGAYGLAYDPILLKSPDCIVQDPRIGNLLGFEGSNDDNFEYLNKSTLSGEDWTNAISIALSLEILSFEEIHSAEIMVKDKISPKYLQAVLEFEGEDDDSQDKGVDFIHLDEKMKFELQNPTKLSPFKRDSKEWKNQLKS